MLQHRFTCARRVAATSGAGAAGPCAGNCDLLSSVGVLVDPVLETSKVTTCEAA